MCKKILSNQEAQHNISSNNVPLAVLRLLPITAQGELDFVNSQLHDKEFKDNLVSISSSIENDIHL